MATIGTTWNHAGNLVGAARACDECGKFTRWTQPENGSTNAREICAGCAECAPIPNTEGNQE